MAEHRSNVNADHGDAAEGLGATAHAQAPGDPVRRQWPFQPKPQPDPSSGQHNPWPKTG